MKDYGELYQQRYGHALPDGLDADIAPGVARILNRRVVRQLESEPLSEARLAQLLACAQSAPTKSDLQQYSIIIVEDPAARERSIRSWGITALTVDAANGLINMALDMVPESADDVLEATAGFGLEIVSLVLSGFSWLASFPSSPGFPGGRPYNVAAHKVSKSKNEQEYWERVMWGWRTAMYWLDVVMLMSNAIDATKGRKFNLQRLKRADEMTIGFFFAF